MKMRKVEAGGALVGLSKQELLILNNALNEVLHGLDIVDLTTRIGAENKEVLTLLDEIGTVYKASRVST